MSKCIEDYICLCILHEESYQLLTIRGKICYDVTGRDGPKDRAQHRRFPLPIGQKSLANIKRKKRQRITRTIFIYLIRRGYFIWCLIL